MDLLSQYKQDHPEAPRKKPSSSLTDEYGREYSRMVALVMRLSGGRIRDARTASYVLVIAAVVILITALTFFYWSAGNDINTKKNFVPAETPAR